MSILAPVATKNERLLSYIERGQSDNALGLLLEMQDAAAESSEAIPPEAILMASSKGFSDVVDALLAAPDAGDWRLKVAELWSYAKAPMMAKVVQSL